MKIEVRIAQWLLAALFFLTGALRLWQALHGAPTSDAVLLMSTTQVLLGVLLATGWQLRIVALCAAVLLLIDAATTHPFWKLSGGSAATSLLAFLRHVSLAAGLLLLSTAGGARRR
ncbi:MAG: hypothetical protein ACK40R_05805 [Thermomonas sp.]